MRRHILCLLGGLLIALDATAAPLKVYYIEKPPYYYSADGEAAGFLLERTRSIFQRAGVEAEFELRPALRILKDLANSLEPACSIGWFKTAERSAYAWFSAPIHQDAPMVVLTRTAMSEQIKRHPGIAALLQGPLRIGVINGFSYGDLDPLIERAPQRNLTATAIQNVRMLAAGRIDYTLVDRQELPFILDEADLHGAGLASVQMGDMPAGKLRYLMCSKSVDADRLERLDEAIRGLESHSR